MRNKGFTPLKVRICLWWKKRYKAKSPNGFCLLNTKHIIKPLTGFTIVEMLVVISIFSIIMVTVTGYFLSIIKTQRYMLASQQLFDQGGYALEYMYKMIRMAKKSDGTLLVGGLPCVNNRYNFMPLSSSGPTTSNILRFVRLESTGGSITKVCEAFQISNGKIIARNGSDQADLTSDDIKVTNLKFYISGDDGVGNSQPKVTILIEAESKMANGPKLRLQTTVSQRDLNLNY